MRNRGTVIIAYLVLFALSLPVPLLHHCQTDRVIATMRPVMQLADGSWSPMLMPVDILLVRWLGQLSWWIPCILVVLLLLSFTRVRFSRVTAISVVAIGQLAFTTFYAFYATLILGMQWLEWVEKRPGPVSKETISQPANLPDKNDSPTR